jgi:trehalose/maltose transport system permease protein
MVLIGSNKHAVETVSMLAWQEMYKQRYGPAAAYATLLFGYIAVVALTFVKVLGADILRRGEGEDA